MTLQSISREAIRELALMQGFDLCCFTKPVLSPQHKAQLDAWVGSGMHGEMGYMAEETRMERRKEPESMLEGIRTVIALGMKHVPPPYSLDEAIDKKGRGVVASYAHGDDYHDVMKKRLKAFARDLDEYLGPHDQRVYVDTAPVLEHALAERAGLGWQGKHTLTINREHGSYLMLGEIFTTAEIEPDAPAGSHCGTCTACIDVCPTRAIVAPFVVDARLCISYLTIESRGFTPLELRPLMGNRIYGCDDCQMVCPWNSKAEVVRLDHLNPRDENILPELATLFGLDDEGFREHFRKSPMKRPGRAGLLRNVAIAMGNSGNPDYIPLLIRALDDPEPLIRGHAAWALGCLYPYAKGEEIVAQLEYHAARETDEEVLNELHRSLENIGESI
ncbi:MAG: tRNA epoxyqueuosine(34) reductase QueG [Mariprofundaceae bacterium]|nr:tRNA epoxyqueuosine(34) reductase QueG [Mariprofundaceae bacterium]